MIIGLAARCFLLNILPKLRENHDHGFMSCQVSKGEQYNSEECGSDKEWLKLMDRGGLYHVKETTFQLFCSIESQVRSVLEALTKPCVHLQSLT